MKLHEMKRPKIKSNKKRLGKGRGTGQGGQAGKGHKGQKSRSGGNIPLWFEGGQMPLQRRIPKRGFNSRNRKEFRIINLGQLKEIKEDDFDVQKLEKLGLIKRSNTRNYKPVKVLAGSDTEFTKKINIKVDAFSKTAKKLIEQNGGKAEVIKID